MDIFPHFLYSRKKQAKLFDCLSIRVRMIDFSILESRSQKMHENNYASISGYYIFKDEWKIERE